MSTIKDYKYEFERLLATAEQAVGAVDFKNRSTPFAPLRALKNAVDHYKSCKAAPPCWFCHGTGAAGKGYFDLKEYFKGEQPHIIYNSTNFEGSGYGIHEK